MGSEFQPRLEGDHAWTDIATQTDAEQAGRWRRGGRERAKSALRGRISRNARLYHAWQRTLGRRFEDSTEVLDWIEPKPSSPPHDWGYISSMDAFTRQRVLELRQEIASLQRDNESYRLQKYRTASEAKRNELRKFRLLAIREELRRLNEHQQKIQ